MEQFHINDSGSDVTIHIDGTVDNLATALLHAYLYNKEARDVLDEFITLLLVTQTPIDENTEAISPN